MKTNYNYYEDYTMLHWKRGKSEMYLTGDSANIQI